MIMLLLESMARFEQFILIKFKDPQVLRGMQLKIILHSIDCFVVIWKTQNVYIVHASIQYNVATYWLYEKLLGSQQKWQFSSFTSVSAEFNATKPQMN